MAVINGTSSGETLDGSAADDTINGLGGDDTIRSLGGADEIHGGDGDDQIDAIYTPGPAFYGFGGPLLVFGDAGDDLIGGSTSADVLNGGADDDYIHGWSGDDSLLGDGGNDTLRGGDGDDTLVGGDGADSLSGDDIAAGADSLLGGLGNDTLSGFGGNDFLDGEEGDDTLHGGDGDDSMLGGAGIDTLFGSAGMDTLLGGADGDSLSGGDDDDSILGEDGVDTLNGGAGNDTLDGGAGSESLFGGEGNDLMLGGDGDDSLFGNEDNDSIVGGAGDDSMSGADGNDTLVDGEGMDTLSGGDGDDTFILNSRDFVLFDSGGSNEIIVQADFVKVPTSIDATPTFAAGVMALPYWLDALLPEGANGFKAHLGGGTTVKYGFPGSKPTYVTGSDATGWTAFNAAQTTFTTGVLTYLSSIINLTFTSTTTYDAPNVMSFANNTQDTTAGYAYFPSSSSVGSDVLMNTGTAGNSAPTDGASPALTWIHEILHALGLKHPFEDGPTLPDNDGDPDLDEDTTAKTVMSYDSFPADYHAVAKVLDIAALHYLYGPSAALNAGSTTHVISESDTNFIADGAGTDTIDASAVSTGVTIYLTPGYWGFVGGAADTLITADGQVTVNFGTVIENLLGSSSADTLVGNTAANDISGNGGDDTITGGEGNDTLNGGTGSDTAVYSGPMANYTVSGSNITDNVGTEGSDSLSNFEFAMFSDGTVALGGPDLTPPTIAITTDDSDLNAGDSALITFTLSESSTNFVEADVTVTGGTLSGFAGAGTAYTATFTPDPNSTADGIVSVASGTFTDASANANVDGADADNTVTMDVDTIRPTIAVTTDDSDLNAGDTATVTFTLSEAATDFIEGDITVTGGTLSNFAGAGTIYTATFTPDDNSTTDGVVSVASTKFSDAAGNDNADGADANNTATMNVDTLRPTIAVTSDDSDLTIGETATITFTLSEAATDFVQGDVTVTGGTLSNFAGAGALYTATFTPDANSTTDGVVSVASTRFTDAAANANADGADADNTVTMTVDTNAVDNTPPTIAITTDDNDLNAGDTASITFTLSESSTNFEEADVTVSGGTLSDFAGAGTVYTATFTPDASSTTDGVVSVASGTFTDESANANVDGADADNTVTMSVDTIRPTIAVTSDDENLNAGDTATVTFTLSEAATDFVEGDVTVTGGTLSNFAGAGTVYTATFTPDAASTTDGVVSVASTKFTDAAENDNADGADANNTVTMTVNTVLPTIAVTTDDNNLTNGETATITFTLSEASTDFVQGDVTVNGGTLTNFAGAGALYTATFTPDSNSTADGVVSVASGKFTNAAANANADGADADNTVTMTVDTAPPTVSISSDDNSLTQGETATITFTLSEAAVDFTQGDVTVAGGALSDFAGAGTNYTATFTPDEDSTDDGVVSVASGTFSDAAANFNTDGADANNTVTMDVNTTENIQGTVADGYVSGAKIYNDANNDGIPDPGEDTGVTTDANGDFTLPGNQSTGPVLAVGGINIDTGLPNDLILSAPMGSTVVNPITSLIQEVIYAEGGTPEASEAKIQTALGIDGDVDLNEYDPLAVDPVDDEAVNIQSIAAQIAVLATLIGDNDTFEDIVSFILANPGEVLGLGDFDLLQSMLPNVDDEVLVQASGINQVLAGADSFEDISETQGDGLDDENDAPVVNGTIINQLTVQSKSFGFKVPDGTFVELDAGDSLTFTATLDDDSSLPGWLSFNPATTTFSGTPDEQDIDQITVKVTAQDESNESVSTSFLLTVVTDSFQVDQLNGTDGFRLDGVAGGDQSGQSVANAGDINGDGFDDLIIGARFADPNDGNSGSTYVVFGDATGFAASTSLADLDGNNGFRLDGVTADDQSGISVSSAGDINGDGYDDLIIGAQNADPNGFGSGSSYVVFGKESGFPAEFDLATLDGVTGFRLDGEALSDNSGFSVSRARDVNGDGFDDLIIGAPNADPNGSKSGSSYVFFGKENGFVAAFDLADLNGNDGFRLDGAAADDQSGISVSSAGDVNGDGFDDLVVGAKGTDFNGDSSGSSFVVFGMADGFAATIDLSSLDGSNGFRLDGEAGSLAGSSVSSAGDVNGDSFDDLIIGAPWAAPNGDRSGTSFVVFGKADGFTSTFNLAELDGSDGFRLDGESSFDYFGYSVSNAGDVNADGYDDLIVGAYGADYNSSGSGSSYLVFGRAEGFTAALDMNNIDQTTGFRTAGLDIADETGWSVSAAGDVNADGFDDIIVGAYRANPGGPDSGTSYVIFGRPLGLAYTYSGVLVEGGPGNDALDGGIGNDTLLGHDGRDTMQGFAGDDELDGGDELDHAIYQEDLADYTIANNEGVLIVTGPASDGEDTVTNTERLHFADQSLAFDLDDRAGTIAKLLGVALGKDNWHNPTYVGIGLDLLDNSVISFESLMDLAFDVVLGPNATNAQVVTLIYTNLVGQGPSQGELNTFVGQIENGTFTQASLGVAAANHPINTTNIDLVGLIDSGLEYMAIG